MSTSVSTSTSTSTSAAATAAAMPLLKKGLPRLQKKMEARNKTTRAIWHPDQKGIELTLSGSRSLHLRIGTVMSIKDAVGNARILKITSFPSYRWTLAQHPQGLFCHEWVGGRWAPLHPPGETWYEMVVSLFPASLEKYSDGCTRQRIQFDLETMVLIDNPDGSPVPGYIQGTLTPEQLGFRLLVAVSEGFEAEVWRLLGEGVTVNCMYNGSTPLWYCCERGYEAIGLRLLAAGANIRWLEHKLLTSACAHNMPILIKALLEQIRPTPNTYLNDLLCIAAKGAHPAIVRMLLEHGAEVNGEHWLLRYSNRNAVEDTPLVLACKSIPALRSPDYRDKVERVKQILLILFERKATLAKRTKSGTAMAVCQPFELRCILALEYLKATGKPVPTGVISTYRMKKIVKTVAEEMNTRFPPFPPDLEYSSEESEEEEEEESESESESVYESN